jgi:hypothetical protein
MRKLSLPAMLLFLLAQACREKQVTSTGEDF